MTPKNDETVTSGTLPSPELNPLLNPTLNKNLGRWAEAYFTNPPERRDQAVINLLRELESETTADGTLPRSRKSFKPRMRENNANTVICSDCGFENEIHQKFCGECGEPIAAPPTARVTVADPPAPVEVERVETEETEMDSSPSEAVESSVPQFGSILHLTDSAPRRSTDASGHSGEPDFVIRDYEEAAPIKRSYRLYIGTALAMIIGGLAYVAWRGGQSTPNGSTLPPPNPPAATQPASSPAVAPSDAPSAQESASSNSAPEAGSEAAESHKNSESGAKPSSTPDTPANAGNSTGISGNGGQELLQAQGFLNGVGKERDSATAAQWLWKAVEKDNTAATVLLGGLYLRGDGVQKNCEQGRILLDAAATKGNKDAADLLRNLQAFGCE